ncbi:hypothetical protein QL093DRAFT_2525387 [Fusarium oxysporum]|nr:hypothetical protein QL093DRAFT_2525387 [Fusarium oxysporum]
MPQTFWTGQVVTIQVCFPGFSVTTHVSLVDPMEGKSTGLPVQGIKNLGQLYVYTINNEKFLPKKALYEDAWLRFLLQEILYKVWFSV